MIDIDRVFCTPVSVSTDPTYIAGSETSCPRNWSGQYVSPSQAYRVMRVRWSEVPFAGVEAFRNMIAQSVGGTTPVVFTPPTDPAGVNLDTPRASQQSTIVGRLVGPFSIKQRGFNSFDLEARLEEDH